MLRMRVRAASVAPCGRLVPRVHSVEKCASCTRVTRSLAAAETLSFGYMLAFDMLYDVVMRFVLRIVEMNVVPDFLLRKGIRFLLTLRLRELKAPTGEEQHARLLVRLAPLHGSACDGHAADDPTCFCAAARLKRRLVRTLTATRPCCAGLCGGPEAASDC